MNKYKQIPQTHNTSHCLFALQSAKGQIGVVGNSIRVEIRRVSRMLHAILFYAAVNFFYSSFKTAFVSPGSLEQRWVSGVVGPEISNSQKGESCEE